jgi:hypothetical protein
MGTNATGGDDRRDPRNDQSWRPDRRDVIRLAAASMAASLTGGFHAAPVAAAGHPCGGGWQHVRDRTQLLVPHSWRRDRSWRGGRARGEENSREATAWRYCPPGDGGCRR